MLEWFKEFETISVEVSDNFTPVHALAWIASECDAALRRDVSGAAAEKFSQTTVADLVRLWREPGLRNYDNWRVFEALTPQSKEISAAGFQFFGPSRYNALQDRDEEVPDNLEKRQLYKALSMRRHRNLTPHPVPRLPTRGPPRLLDGTLRPPD